MKVYIQFPRTSEFDSAIVNKLSEFGGVFQKDKELYYFMSPLKGDYDLTDHIVWLCNFLDNHRKLIKRMTNSGVKVTCICKLNKQARDKSIDLKPQALALAHLLGIGIRIV